MDTTSGSGTVKLPNAPAGGTLNAVKQVILGTGNTVTIQCQVPDVINKTGGGTTQALTLTSPGSLLHYSGAGIWTVLSDDLPLSQLDLRYQQQSLQPWVTVSPYGIANGKSTVANNGAQYGPDTAGTVTSGIQEAVTTRLRRRSRAPPTSAAAARQVRPLAVHQHGLPGRRNSRPGLRGIGRAAAHHHDPGHRAAMTAPEGTSYTDGFSLGATVIDASALDVLAQGLYKQGRVFLVPPYAQTGSGLVSCPIAAMQLTMENMVIVVPAYNVAGAGSPAYSVNGASQALFVSGDTASPRMRSTGDSSTGSTPGRPARSR